MTSAWPGTVHLICEWHFIKNVKENLKNRLGVGKSVLSAPRNRNVDVCMQVASLNSTVGSVWVSPTAISDVS